ncbi:MAG: c-type cytochrome [Steroidobacteraceae bacterium]
MPDCPGTRGRRAYPGNRHGRAAGLRHQCGIAHRAAVAGGHRRAGQCRHGHQTGFSRGRGCGAADPKDGTQVYEQVCSACHGLGIAGAPKAGDVAAWGPRIAKGKTVLYDHALHGFSGQAGVMPAKGNRLDIPDAIIEEGVDHMVSLVKH